MTILENFKNSDNQNQNKNKGKRRNLKFLLISQLVNVSVYILPVFLMNRHSF